MAHCPLFKALGIVTPKAIVLNSSWSTRWIVTHNTSPHNIIVVSITYQTDIKVSSWTILCNVASDFARNPRKGMFWADLGRVCHRLVFWRSLGDEIWPGSQISPTRRELYVALLFVRLPPFIFTTSIFNVSPRLLMLSYWEWQVRREDRWVTVNCWNLYMIIHLVDQD